MFQSIIIVKYLNNVAMLKTNTSIWDIDDIIPMLENLNKNLLMDPDLLCKELTTKYNNDLTIFHHMNQDYVWVIDCFNKRVIAYINQGCVEQYDHFGNYDEIKHIMAKYPEVGDLEVIPGTRYLGVRVWEYDLRYMRAYATK